MNDSKSPIVGEFEYMLPPNLVSVSGRTIMNSSPLLEAASMVSGTCMKAENQPPVMPKPCRKYSTG